MLVQAKFGTSEKIFKENSTQKYTLFAYISPPPPYSNILIQLIFQCFSSLHLTFFTLHLTLTLQKKRLFLQMLYCLLSEPTTCLKDQRTLQWKNKSLDQVITIFATSTPVYRTQLPGPILPLHRYYIASKMDGTQ